MNLPEDVAQFLKDHMPYPPLEEGDLTADIAAKAWGCSRRHASQKLNDLAENGKMRKVWKTRTGVSGAKAVTVFIPLER